MDSLYQKSQNTLEFPRVLELLAEHAVSDSAKALARELKPSSDLAEVSLAIEKTSDAGDLSESRALRRSLESEILLQV